MHSQSTKIYERFFHFKMTTNQIVVLLFPLLSRWFECVKVQRCKGAKINNISTELEKLLR